MSTKLKKTTLVCLLGTLALTSGPSYGDEAREAPRAMEDQSTIPEALDSKGEVISKIAIGKGDRPTEIEFIALPDGFGGNSVGVLEIHRGGLGLSDLPRLAESTNPREIFHALAEKGMQEPALLTNSYDAPQLGKAGWGRAALRAMPVSDDQTRAIYNANCSFSGFLNSFNALRPDINSTKYQYSAVDGDHDTAGGDFYTQPWAQTWWLNYASNARGLPWNNQYHNYTFYNVDKFKTRVRVCKFETGNEFQDRYVQFRYRSENNVVKAAAYHKELTASDIGVQFTYIWAPTNGQKNYDWVTLVGGSTVYPNHHPDDRYFVVAQKK